MRTVKQLLSLEGRVYVCLSDEAVCSRFLRDAESEGFTFGDGVRPTQRTPGDIYALNRDMTLNYVGYVGHLAFRSAAAGGAEPLVRVDYGKYAAGEDFLMPPFPPSPRRERT